MLKIYDFLLRLIFSILYPIMLIVLSIIVLSLLLFIFSLLLGLFLMMIIISPVLGFMKIDVSGEIKKFKYSRNKERDN